MNIKDFCEERPYLYHLTDSTNLPHILKAKHLISTKQIVESAFGKTKKAKDFLREKREGHETIMIGKISYKIRDQRPILVKVLDRSLSGGLNAGDFIELLNKRVFMWPTVDRLTRHFNRYESEKPVILKVKTEDILAVNANVEYCRLNSGATRCHPTYGGNAPTRGKDSFLSANLYNDGIRSVAEVTFVHLCQLPNTIWIGKNPNGSWTKHDL